MVSREAGDLRVSSETKGVALPEVRDRLFAVLDTTDPDVLPTDSPLFDLPNGFLTPHIAGSLGREAERLADCIVEEVERFAIYPRRSPRPDERYLGRLEALREWRKQTGLDIGVASDVVLPRDLMLTLAGENPSQPEELKQVLKDVPWRLEHFGSQILELLNQRNSR